jgi:hypothetical protein
LVAREALRPRDQPAAASFGATAPSSLGSRST